MRAVRRGAFVLATLVAMSVLPACTQTRTPGTPPFTILPTRTGGQGGGQRTPTPGVPTRTASFEPQQTRPAPSGNGTTVAYADGGFVGGMARTYLRSEPALRLEIEIDAVQGMEWPAAAEEHARQILHRELLKPDGIAFRRDDSLAGDGGMRRGGGDDIYSLPEIHRIAGAARDAGSSGSTATLHLLVLDGESDEVPSALGIAINASTMVLFAERIEDAAAPLVGAREIWKSVTIHELGHLLGLVEIVQESETSRHDDPSSPGHSPNEDSVMYWAIEDAGIAAVLGDGPPQDFDGPDRADLAAMRR